MALDFEQVWSWGNLWQAYKDASKRKRGRPSVAAFEYRLEEHLLELQDELRHHTYRPGSYESFWIHEPKRRLISAAPFRDRVVHHALCHVIEPAFERRFIAGTYANRRGKGTHRALDRAQTLAREHAYVLQCDVQQFFPSIDHAILQSEIEKTITDSEIRRLVGAILQSGEGVLADAYDMVWFSGDDLFAVLRRRGLPIGNLTSQLWANVYLNPFDHFVTRELGCSAYVRYVDDLLLFGSDRRGLHAWRAAIEARLGRLRLAIHPGAHPRPVSEGFPFLGFTVFPYRRRLKRRKVVHTRRRLARLLDGYASGTTPRIAVATFVKSWLNHARYGNTVGLRKAILRDVVL